MSDDLATYRQWIGRGETREDFAAPFPPHALIQTFDTGDSRLKTGDALPPLWQLAVFSRHHAALQAEPGRSAGAGRLHAAGDAAQAHVGRQPVHLP